MTSAELWQALSAKLEPPQAEWLAAAGDYNGVRHLAAFVGAGRRLGSTPLGNQSGWNLALAGRIYLLLRLAESAPDAGTWITKAYSEGDSREKAAVISALASLPKALQYLPLALDAQRTNESELFCSLALHNPFPAEHYSEAEFNQLVMKATFSNLDLAEIVGLDKRCNPELARMGMEYIDERLSAGRSYPSSLWLAIAPHCPAGGVARMLGELAHSQSNRRIGAAHGLALAKDPRALAFLEERLSIEPQQPVRQALLASIESHQGPT